MTPAGAQAQRIRAAVRVFMQALPAAKPSASFDEIRAALPAPERAAPDGAIHQALIDEGFEVVDGD